MTARYFNLAGGNEKLKLKQCKRELFFNDLTMSRDHSIHEIATHVSKMVIDVTHGKSNYLSDSLKSS